MNPETPERRRRWDQDVQDHKCTELGGTCPYLMCCQSAVFMLVTRWYITPLTSCMFGAESNKASMIFNFSKSNTATALSWIIMTRMMGQNWRGKKRSIDHNKDYWSINILCAAVEATTGLNTCTEHSETHRTRASYIRGKAGTWDIQVMFSWADPACSLAFNTHVFDGSVCQRGFRAGKKQSGQQKLCIPLHQTACSAFKSMLIFSKPLHPHIKLQICSLQHSV